MSDEYKIYVDEVNKRLLSNSEAFDKAVLTLSSSFLGLSLIFYRSVIPEGDVYCIEYLKYSWVSFVVAIISTVLSFFASQASLKDEAFYAERYYNFNDDDYENKQSKWTRITEFLNLVSAFGFILGVVLMFMFVTKNI